MDKTQQLEADDFCGCVGRLFLGFIEIRRDCDHYSREYRSWRMLPQEICSPFHRDRRLRCMMRQHGNSISNFPLEIFAGPLLRALHNASGNLLWTVLAITYFEGFSTSYHPFGFCNDALG